MPSHPIPPSRPSYPPFRCRPYEPAQAAAARALALAAGVHGIYVANALAAGLGETVLCWGADALLGCLWFGPRGNLVILCREPLDPDAVAGAVHQGRWPWRIALGPGPVIDALSTRLSGVPLVHRDQVYHGCAPAQARPPATPLASRRALRGDRDRLMQATLELNRADLNVDPRRVDRRWLRDMVDARIADGSTLVVGPVGQLESKLDLGSRGAAGLVLEGVFTFPGSRGRGLATALVGTVAARATEPFVCLHVAADNRPARAAYDRAGLTEQGRCRLLLSG